MHTSLLVVMVALASAASPVSAYHGTVVSNNGPHVRSWPWLGSRGPMHSSHPRPGLFPSNVHDFSWGSKDYPDSSDLKTPSDDLDQQVAEVQRRCHDDFLLLRRLLEKQGHPLRGPQRDIPWVYPIFRVPYSPEDGTDAQHPDTFDGFPPQEEVDYEDYYDLGHDPDYADKDYPTSWSVWPLHPFLPKTPVAEDLPDNYENATHDVHTVNGTRVEVNTTTHKETGDSHATFFHTKIIHILPDEEPKVKTPEENEGTTETTFTTDKEDASTTMMSPEDPPVEDKTENELPPFDSGVPAELVVHEVRGSDSRPARDVPSKPTTKPEVQQSASYVRRPSKNKKDDQPPRDLSGDTLVNHLPGDKIGDKPKDPDAEIIP